MKEIIAVVCNGIVDEVLDMPKGYRLIVRDYDTEGFPLEEVQINGEGETYYEYDVCEV